VVKVVKAEKVKDTFSMAMEIREEKMRQNFANVIRNNDQDKKYL
jgi:hypothetical protein